MIHKKKFKPTHSSRPGIYSIHHHKSQLSLLFLFVLVGASTPVQRHSDLRTLSDQPATDIISPNKELSINILDP